MDLVDTFYSFSQCSQFEKKEEVTSGEANFSISSMDINTDFIHKNIWSGFFRWLEKKSPWSVSKLGYLVTVFSAVRRSFLEFIHAQRIGSLGCQVFSNDEAVKIIVKLLASQTAALSTTTFGKIGKYIWDYSFGIVLVIAVGAAYLDRLSKVYRYVGRCLGFEMEEPIDEAKAQKESLGKLVKQVAEISDRLCEVEAKIQEKKEEQS